MAKKNWMKIHTYLSLFFMPMCLIYVLTGVGYIFKLKDDAGAKIHTIALESPLQEGREKEMIIDILKANNLKVPQNTNLEVVKGNLSMGNIKYVVSIQKDKSGQLVLKTMERSLYGVFVLMHKAKGGAIFNALAICFATSLLIFYLSGLIVTTFCKRNRKVAGIAFSSGLIICGIAIYLSV